MMAMGEGMAGKLARVTLVGHSQEELAIRAAVLHHFWRIETVALDEGASPNLDTEVVVILHTVPEPERQEWVSRLRAEAPTLLLVRENGFESGPHAGADATVDVAHGPGAMISAIYELLTERGLGSRMWSDEIGSALLQ